MTVFDPARGVGDLGEGGCVALGKSVAAESLDLLEGALGEILGIAARDHAADQLVVEVRDPAGELEGGHSAAELIGFCRRKPGTDDRHLHCLLLKQRNAQGLFEHGTQLGLGIFGLRSEEHTSELQSLMRISYAVFCLKKKTQI